MPDRQRLLSALIALGHLSAMRRREGWHGALALLVALLVPLALAMSMIWYAGTISRSPVWSWMHKRVDRPTPPSAVRGLGWILLLIPLMIIAVQRLQAL